MDTMNKKRYWISTNKYIKPVLFQSNTMKPPSNLSLVFGLRECTFPQYHLFLRTGINVMDRDKFYWFKRKIKRKISELFGRK